MFLIFLVKWVELKYDSHNPTFSVLLPPAYILNQSVTILQWFNRFLPLLIVISHVSISFLYDSCAGIAQTFKSHTVTANFCLWCKPFILSFLKKIYTSDLFHSLIITGYEILKSTEFVLKRGVWSRYYGLCYNMLLCIYSMSFPFSQ